MRNLLVVVGIAIFLGGCYMEEVRTYDAQGNLLGRCEAGPFFIDHFVGGSAATCVGSANPKDQGAASVPQPQQDQAVATKCPSGDVFLAQFKTCVPASWEKK